MPRIIAQVFKFFNRINIHTRQTSLTKKQKIY
jgi:hypothetical protein